MNSRETSRNRSVRPDRSVPDLQQGLNLNFDSTALAAQQSLSQALLLGCPPYGQPHQIDSLTNGLRIDPTLLNPLGPAATPAMLGASSLPFQNTSMQAAQFLAAQSSLNSLPIPPGWTLPLRPNLAESDLLSRQSQMPQRSNRAQSPSDSTRMECDPPKLKSTSSKHRIARKESSRQIAAVFPTSKEPQSVIVQPGGNSGMQTSVAGGAVGGSSGLGGGNAVGPAVTTKSKYRNRKHSPLSRSPSPAVSVITISSESDEDKQTAARNALKNAARPRHNPTQNNETLPITQPSPIVPPRPLPSSAGQSPSAFLPINDAQVSSSTQRPSQQNRDQEVSFNIFWNRKIEYFGQKIEIFRFKINNLLKFWQLFFSFDKVFDPNFNFFILNRNYDFLRVQGRARNTFMGTNERARNF